MIPENIKEDRTDPVYWNWRVKSHAHVEKQMIWYGAIDKYDRLTRLVDNVLSTFKDCKVLDVGCGYGRFAHNFKPENYLGVDFSEEMIKLAQSKYPNYKFLVADVREWKPTERFDVVFEVMAGGQAAKFESFADKALVILSPSESKIKFLDI